MRVRLSIPYVLCALSVSVPCAAQTAGAKEARDWTRGEPFSFKDLGADGIGIAVFVVLTALADR